MTSISSISDSSAAFLARSLDPSLQPEVSLDDQGGSSLQDGTDHIGCTRQSPDVFPDETIGDSWSDDAPVRGNREMYVNDEGQVGWRTVVNGTSGDDTIDVTLNADGSADVTINGETTHYTPEQAENMRITGGAGDDTITVTDNRLLPFSREGGDVTIDGGSGNDNISGDLKRVNAEGGTGNDTINGFPDFPVGPLPPIFIPL